MATRLREYAEDLPCGYTAIRNKPHLDVGERLGVRSGAPRRRRPRGGPTGLQRSAHAGWPYPRTVELPEPIRSMLEAQDERAQRQPVPVPGPGRELPGLGRQIPAQMLELPSVRPHLPASPDGRPDALSAGEVSSERAATSPRKPPRQEGACLPRRRFAARRVTHRAPPIYALTTSIRA